MKQHDIFTWSLMICSVLGGQNLGFPQVDQMQAHEQRKPTVRQVYPDTDGDGKMSFAEYGAVARERFREMDNDRHGYVTVNELRTTQKTLRQDHHGRHDRRRAEMTLP